MSTRDAVGKIGSICSVLGLVAVVVLQRFALDDRTLLFWWLTTTVIGVAAASVCFTQPSFPLRVVFVIVFVAQMPAFVTAWSDRTDTDTRMVIEFFDKSPEQEKIDRLESENKELKSDRLQSLQFWKSMAHLTGMGFAMIACVAQAELPNRDRP